MPKSGTNCTFVFTAHKPLDVTLTKIRHTEMKGSKATELQRFRRTEGKYNHLRKSEEQQCQGNTNYSSPLLKRLFGVQITDLSCYLLQQTPETVLSSSSKIEREERIGS